MSIHVPITILDGAKMPAYAHADDAGMDLFSNQHVTLQPLERALIPTGIAVAIPPGYEGQVRPKSGLAINHGITVLNTPGTIDSGYRGEIKVILINLGNQPYTVDIGTKIAQLVIARIEHATIEKVSTLDETKRGAGGFGSTGKH